jgi:hypothetical protein
VTLSTLLSRRRTLLLALSVRAFTTGNAVRARRLLLRADKLTPTVAKVRGFERMAERILEAAHAK